MPIEKRYKIRRATKGHDTPEVTIPKEWCAFHGLEIGDEVKVMADGVVVIVPSGRRDLEEKTKEFLDKR